MSQTLSEMEIERLNKYIEQQQAEIKQLQEYSCTKFCPARTLKTQARKAALAKVS